MITPEDEKLIKDLLFLMRERRKLEREIDVMRIQAVNRFDEVDGLPEYFIEQSKRILDE